MKVKFNRLREDAEIEVKDILIMIGDTEYLIYVSSNDPDRLTIRKHNDESSTIMLQPRVSNEITLK